MRVMRVIGPIYGASVRSHSIVGDFLGGIRAVFGGKRAGDLNMIAQARVAILAQLAGPRRMGLPSVSLCCYREAEFVRLSAGAAAYHHHKPCRPQAIWEPAGTIAMITSKLTSKAQTTIPQPVRIALHLREGDEIVYRIEDGLVWVGASRGDGDQGAGTIRLTPTPAVHRAAGSIEMIVGSGAGSIGQDSSAVLFSGRDRWRS
ncbi:type II toxin-antitoxin system PrlF family antitoxin [Acidithiobacillus sp.]|uniref:AbrB/MazE/SpoVT family DNA-binding domain-containing protein n=1 Tax=Acidithiobacillus sp. TaxID=1872118 RepID=UPI002602DC77|nr:type II toxin-antitoxin system PrlF family antitoxin [Acidithiobacillus sp.]